jgi:uncharacterized protein YndB with AHSA1/START domain
MTTARQSKRMRGVSTADVKIPWADGFLRGNVTKLKILLPVGKPRAWALIATPEGLASWFPAACRGRAAVGESLAFQWDDGSVENFRIRRLGDKRSSVAFAWRRGAEWRIYLHGRHTTLTLEVEYGPGMEGRREQLRELPLWAFRLANLKSVALSGRDLRGTDARRGGSSAEGFIDVAD